MNAGVVSLLWVLVGVVLLVAMIVKMDWAERLSRLR